MKKLICLAVAILLCIGLVACGGQKSLYDRGLEVIDLISEKMNNKDYIKMLGSETILNAVSEYLDGATFTNPTAVYELTMDVDKMLSMYEVSLDGMSDTLKREVRSSLLQSLSNQFNSSLGSEAIAASSILSSGISFKGSIEKDTIYIYEFENAYPVIVTFIKGNDGVVGASGKILFVEKLDVDSMNTEFTSINKIK